MIQEIIRSFALHFAPEGVLLYSADSDETANHSDRVRLAALGVTMNQAGKIPDVVIHHEQRNRLFLVDSVTGHGPVKQDRHSELSALFAGSNVGLVFVNAFPSRMVMARYLDDISWESAAWVADEPTHLIHFNGARLGGPYAAS